MGVCKMKSVLAVCLLAIAFSGCRQTVSQEKYDDIVREYNELKQSVEDAQNSNVQQAVTLNQTLNELAEISGTTELLRSDIERGSAKLSQAEKISKSISSIKRKIDDLESKVSDKTYVRMVNNLKTIVREKEKEIEGLKQVIQEQEGTIKAQEGTISEQNDRINEQLGTISAQAEQLRNIVAQQAALLNQAGKDFEEMGDDIPEVSRKKNKRKVESWAASMYSTAIIYYKRAESYGHQQSSYDIRRVEAKLRNLSH